MEVICVEEPAFYALIEKVVAHLNLAHGIEKKEWITPEEAMALLNLGKTTMQSLRDNGEIRYTQPQRNNILYSRTSIMEYLERHAKNTF
jgi:excisionase family DNA binding protein